MSVLVQHAASSNYEHVHCGAWSADGHPCSIMLPGICSILLDIQFYTEGIQLRQLAAYASWGGHYA